MLQKGGLIFHSAFSICAKAQELLQGQKNESETTEVYGCREMRCADEAIANGYLYRSVVSASSV